jgi:PAS domain S-box-containing protein
MRQLNATLEETLRADLERFQSVVEAAPDAIVIIGGDGRISLVNRQTERVFGYDREALIGHAVEILIPERFRDGHRGHRTRYVAAPSTRPMGAELDLFARRRDGSEFAVEISLSPLPTDSGLLTIGAIRDITARRRLETENARLLRSAQEQSEQLQLAIQEAHHRIKNNLQAVSNLLYLARDATEEPSAKEALWESMERVQAIALVHDMLSQEEGIQTVDLRSVAERLIPMILSNNGIRRDAVHLTLNVPATPVSSRTGTTLALILNELTNNAVKHALAPRVGGELTVCLSPAADGYLLRVQDDGPGLPPGFDLANDGNLGLLVVNTLVTRDLEGRLEFASHSGLCVEVWFPWGATGLSRVGTSENEG